tara:strand:- start:9737 stop:10150 length:414 start_codon:yes stop_codon:yes gene_type:complete
MIQNYMVELFALLVLILLTILDIRKREFPAIITSALLFVVAIVNISNIEFGVLAFILGWLLLDIDFIRGTGDLKVITIMGLFVSNMGMFFLLTILILIVGTVYKLLMVKVMKQKDETAFIPALLVVFITFQIVNYLI